MLFLSGEACRGVGVNADRCRGDVAVHLAGVSRGRSTGRGYPSLRMGGREGPNIESRGTLVWLEAVALIAANPFRRACRRQRW